MQQNLKQRHLLLTMVVLFWFAQYVYIPYQTPYLILNQVSNQLIGTIIGAYGLSQLILRLPVGLLADLRGNHNLIISLGLFCSGFASLFRLLWPNGLGFLIGNIFSGIASATWISFMVLYMSFFTRKEQTNATSTLILANNLGMLLGFMTSTLLYDQLGMKFICFLSLLAGGLGLICSRWLTPPTKQNGSLSISELLKVGCDKRLLFFAFLALIQQGIQMSTTMSFTNQLLKNLGASNGLVGLSSIIYMLSAVIFARLNSTQQLRNIRPSKLVSVLFISLAAYCRLVPLAQNLWLICLLQLIPGMATGILFSVLTAEAMKNVPANKKSTAMGYFQAIYAIGMTLFPIISGQLSEHFSLQTAYLSLALVACLGAVGMWLVKGRS